MRKRDRWIMLLLALLSLLALFPGGGAERQIDGTNFTRVVKDLANDGLGYQEIQAYLKDEVNYVPQSQANGEEEVQKIIRLMQLKFGHMKTAVKKIRDAVQTLLNDRRTFTQGDPGAEHYRKCCDFKDLHDDPRFPNITINNETMCVLGPFVEKRDVTFPDKKSLVETMKNLPAWQNHPELKWLFVASEENYLISYPAAKVCWPKFIPRIRPWYQEVVSRWKKDLVIVVDKSRSMLKSLANVREAVSDVLSTLGFNDRFGLVVFDQKANFPSAEQTLCESGKLAKAIPKNIEALQKFVKQIAIDSTTGGESFYIEAIHKAFQYFHNSPTTEKERSKVILFVSDGLPSDDDNGVPPHEQILRVISEENAKLNNSVIIHTYGIGHNGEHKEAKQLLKHMAEQTMNNLTLEVFEGEYHAIDDSRQLSDIMVRYYSSQFSTIATKEQPVYSVPYHDGFGFGIILTACLPIFVSGNMSGVACADMQLRDLFVNVTVFQKLDIGYTFMLDQTGRFVYHPLLPLSRDKNDPPVYADFSLLEQAPGATRVRDSMIRGESNCTDVTTKYVTPRGTTQSAGIDYKKVTLRYCWAKVPNTNFSVCVVFNETEQYKEFAPPSHPPKKVIYDRTDLTKHPPPMCNHFGRAYFKDNTTLTLTVRCYDDPTYYYNQGNISANDVEVIEKFFEGKKKGTNTFHIKDKVNNTVAVFYDKLTEIWSNKPDSREYTMIAYVGTRDGVFITMPGNRHPRYYDHTIRIWYIKAMNSKDGYALVGPYKDASSGLMIATLSKTLSAPGGQILGVAAIDFSLTHLYYHLTEAYEQCGKPEYSCMIIDDNGAVVLHRDFTESSANIEHTLLVHKEPEIARKLFDENVMSSDECINIKTKNYQMFLKVDLPTKGLKVDGLFEMHKVPETNVFIIIKLSSITGSTQCLCGTHPDNSGTPKCPEKYNEKCRCPCYKPADFNFCANSLPGKTSYHDAPLPCVPDMTSFPFEDLVEIEKDMVAKLQPCYRHNCASKTNQLSCEGVFSCTWCFKSVCKPTSECPPDGEGSSTQSPTVQGKEPCTGHLGIIAALATIAVSAVCALGFYIIRMKNQTAFKKSTTEPSVLYTMTLPTPLDQGSTNNSLENASTDSVGRLTGTENYEVIEEQRGARAGANTNHRCNLTSSVSAAESPQPGGAKSHEVGTRPRGYYNNERMREVFHMEGAPESEIETDRIKQEEAIADFRFENSPSDPIIDDDGGDSEAQNFDCKKVYSRT